ncbi:hypothetical protein CDL12_15764 [Handroanthus impetiginosus]|uniref:Uncharacterized protein n=1 Tax=Handroanthus impetiginosus TaxID=429701 RepID=A0A2G9H291_9LAMI|nr:hypothetical protein CDL12_15764 [Handroanthus impetiginosus]
MDPADELTDLILGIELQPSDSLIAAKYSGPITQYDRPAHNLNILHTVCKHKLNIYFIYFNIYKYMLNINYLVHTQCSGDLVVIKTMNVSRPNGLFHIIHT